MAIWGVVVDNTTIEGGQVVITCPLFVYRVVRVLLSEFGLSKYLYTEGLTDSTDALVSEFLSSEAVDLDNYYTKTEVDVKDTVLQLAINAVSAIANQNQSDIASIFGTIAAMRHRFDVINHPGSGVSFSDGAWSVTDRHLIFLQANDGQSWLGENLYYSLRAIRDDFTSISLSVSNGNLSITSSSAVTIGRLYIGGDR